MSEECYILLTGPPPTSYMNKPIAVIAGNYEQYRRWCHDSGFNQKEAVFIDSYEKGLAREFCAIAKIGTWYMLQNAGELVEFVRTRVR